MSFATSYPILHKVSPRPEPVAMTGLCWCSIPGEKLWNKQLKQSTAHVSATIQWFSFQPFFSNTRFQVRNFMWDKHDGGKSCSSHDTKQEREKKGEWEGAGRNLRGKRRGKCKLYLGHGQGESFPLQNFIFLPKLNIDQTHPGAVYCTEFFFYHKLVQPSKTMLQWSLSSL